MHAQLLTVPPWAVGFVVAISLSYSADHFNARGVHIACASIVGGVGWLTAGLLPPTAYIARYCCLCLAACGAFPCAPSLTNWVTCNTPSLLTIPLCIALNNSCAGIGQIIAQWIWKAGEKESGYPTGNFVCAACSFYVAGSAIGLRWWYGRMNKGGRGMRVGRRGFGLTERLGEREAREEGLDLTEGREKTRRRPILTQRMVTREFRKRTLWPFELRSELDMRTAGSGHGTGLRKKPTSKETLDTCLTDRLLQTGVHRAGLRKWNNESERARQLYTLTSSLTTQPGCCIYIEQATWTRTKRAHLYRHCPTAEQLYNNNSSIKVRGIGESVRLGIGI